MAQLTLLRFDQGVKKPARVPIDPQKAQCIAEISEILNSRGLAFSESLLADLRPYAPAREHRQHQQGDRP
jgi:hypothetical protein